MTSQATITKPLPELLPPRRSGENVSNLQVLRIAAGIIFEMFPAPRKALTKFFSQFVLQRFSRVFTSCLQGVYKAFTRPLQGCYEAFTVFFHILQGAYKAVYKDCARFSIVFSCLVQSCYTMFINAAARLLQVFYNDFYVIFTRCLTKLFTRCFTECLQSVLQKLLIMFLQCV